MLYYLLFWTILGFIIHFYIIFWTNLLTGGPAQICYFFCLFQCFEEKEYQTESKRNEINWRSYFWKETHLMDLDPTSEDTRGAHEGGGTPTPLGRAPYLMGPSVLHQRTPSSYIYTYVPPNDQNRSQKPNSTAATFCIHEIQSWGLFQSSAGEGRHHGGLLHHHSLSDEV